MDNIIDRFHALQRVNPALNLYALVDGYQYEQHFGERMHHQPGMNRPILLGTDDEPLAHAGPWLVDVTAIPEIVQKLHALERALPAISWLITAVSLVGLSQLLQLKLDVKLPDGRVALLRFYDPRILGNLIHTMNKQQQEDFFDHIDEWHFLYNGKPKFSRSPRAQAY